MFSLIFGGCAEQHSLKEMLQKWIATKSDEVVSGTLIEDFNAQIARGMGGKTSWALKARDMLLDSGNRLLNHRTANELYCMLF